MSNNTTYVGIIIAFHSHFIFLLIYSSLDN